MWSILHFLVCKLELCSRILGPSLRAGRSSDSGAPTSESFDYPINPAQQMHLQFGLFSIPGSGPKLVLQRLW